MLDNAASRMRYVIGSALVLLGAAAAVYSPFRPWYDGRLGRTYGVDDLFDGITDVRSSIMASIFLAMLAAAVVAVIGVVMRSRLLMVVAALIVLGTGVLWMIRQGQISDGLSVTSSGDGLGVGVANAFGGAALMLLGAAVMGNQRKAAATGRHRRGETPYEPVGERVDEPSVSVREPVGQTPVRPFVSEPPAGAPPVREAPVGGAPAARPVSEPVREPSTQPVGEPTVREVPMGERPVSERPVSEPVPDNVVKLPEGVRREEPDAPDWRQTADGSPDGPRHDQRDAA